MDVRSEIMAWLTVRAAEIVTDVDDTAMLAGRVENVAALDAVAFASEITDIARVIGESVRGDVAFKSLLVMPDFENDPARDAVHVLSAVGLAIGIGRVTWTSRGAARGARALLIERAHLAYAVAGPLGPEFYAWLSGIVALAVRLISEVAANATPVVRVESGISLPSTVLAYQMYGDAKRASGLVDIAGAATPMVMPAVFEALAS